MPNLKKVAIIDYQLSNLFSVKHACEVADLNATITSDPKDLINSDAIILPGVGAFGDAMKNLEKLGLISPIQEHAHKNKPILGICLGLQLLFDSSEEFGNHRGLGIVKGSVLKFPPTNSKGELIKIPQIGWNKIEIQKEDPLLAGAENGEFMYFVHSFFVFPKEEAIILTKTSYEGIEYASGISQNNVFAVQFHPEKSGSKGLKLYENFAKIIHKV